MSDVKTMYFPDGGNNSALETALLANGGGMNGFNNPLWALIFLAFLGRNGGLWGGNGDNNCQMSQIQSQLNTNQGQTLLMDAIKGNAASIHELAAALGCNANAIQSAINDTRNAVCNGTANLANTIQSVGCDIKQQTITQGYENRINNLQQSQQIANGFSTIGYENAQNTCAIKQAINDQTIAIDNKIDALESSRKDREIATLTAQLATANARAERQAELAPIFKALSDIQNKQPSTVSVPYPQLTAVPSYYLNGIYGTNANGFL